LNIFPFLPGRDWVKKGVPLFVNVKAIKNNNKNGETITMLAMLIITSKNRFRNKLYILAV
jgi:hypothetical protein